MARRTGMSRNSVRKYLGLLATDTSSDSPEPDSRTLAEKAYNIWICRFLHECISGNSTSTRDRMPAMFCPHDLLPINTPFFTTIPAFLSHKLPFFLPECFSLTWYQRGSKGVLKGY